MGAFVLVSLVLGCAAAAIAFAVLGPDRTADLLARRHGTRRARRGDNPPYRAEHRPRSHRRPTPPSLVRAAVSDTAAQFLIAVRRPSAGSLVPAPYRPSRDSRSDPRVLTAVGPVRDLGAYRGQPAYSAMSEETVILRVRPRSPYPPASVRVRVPVPVIRAAAPAAPALPAGRPPGPRRVPPTVRPAYPHPDPPE